MKACPIVGSEQRFVYLTIILRKRLQMGFWHDILDIEQKLIKLNMIIAMNSNDFWEGLDVYKIMVEWIENIVFCY